MTLVRRVSRPERKVRACYTDARIMYRLFSCFCSTLLRQLRGYSKDGCLMKDRRPPTGRLPRDAFDAPAFGVMKTTPGETQVPHGAEAQAAQSIVNKEVIIGSNRRNWRFACQYDKQPCTGWGP